MENLSEKDIDYIFREGSKRHEFPFKESSWDNMEHMLDKQDRTRKYTYLSIAIVGLIVFALGLSYFHNTSDNIKESSPNQEIASSDASHKAAEIDNNTPNSLSEITDMASEKAIASTNETFENNLSQKSKINQASNNTVTLKDEFGVKLNKTFANKDLKNINTNSNTPIAKTNFFETVDPITKITFSNPESIPNENNTLEINQTLNAESVFAKDIGLAAASTLGLLTTNKVINTNKNTVFPAPEIIKRNKPSKFGINLVAGVEWTTVDHESGMTMGYRLGGEIFYRLNNKFSINSGVIFSKKTYQTIGEKYKPLSSWAKGAIPHNVAGICDVIEIPLELSYFVSGSRNNSIFITGGINTYLMNNEDYMYDFVEPQFRLDPDIPKGWNNDNVDMQVHYLGIASFSVGYQKQLNQHTALQLAPYIQMPLTKIGWGQVNLVTMGVQMKVAFSK